MEPKDYIVSKIEGEYAYLRLLDSSDDQELYIAMALLPPNTDIGTKLHYEMLQYIIID